MAAPSERLIVISDRLPVKLRAATGGSWRAEKSSGGLATAMNPILRQRAGVWIGWPGESSGIGNPKRQDLTDKWKTQDALVSVEIPLETANHFYEGYSNQTLWPLFHHFPSRLRFDQKCWAAYRTANAYRRKE